MCTCIIFLARYRTLRVSAHLFMSNLNGCFLSIVLFELSLNSSSTRTSTVVVTQCIIVVTQSTVVVTLTVERTAVSTRRRLYWVARTSRTLTSPPPRNSMTSRTPSSDPLTVPAAATGYRVSSIYSTSPHPTRSASRCVPFHFAMVCCNIFLQF